MNTPVPTHLDVTSPALRTRHMAKSYATIRALQDLNLQVPEEAIYVLVGPNGAGKSTLLECMLDLVRPDSGEIEVLGLDPRDEGPLVRAQIGYLPEGRNWSYDQMTVQRLLDHHAVFYPAWDTGYAARLSETFDLALDQPFGALSKGQARQVQLTMALAHRPPILLLDEPTDGLDPKVRDETLGLLADHVADSPTTLLVSTHHVQELNRLADHLGVIRDGHLVAQVSLDDLHRRLRRYRADVPTDWSAPADLDGTIVRRDGLGREIQWTVWGEQDRVVAHLTSAGATIRDVTPVSLEEAAVALLNAEDGS